jgi:hypothetical protein
MLVWLTDALYSFSSYFVILVTYPAGKWLAQVLPDKRIRFLRWSFSLNPGQWNYKEHLLGKDSIHYDSECALSKIS